MLIGIETDTTLYPEHVIVNDLPAGMEVPSSLYFGGRQVQVYGEQPTGRSLKRNSDVSRTMPVLRCSSKIMSALQLPEQVLHVQMESGAWRIGPTVALYADAFTNTGRMFGEQTRLFEDLTHRGTTVGVDIVVLTPSIAREGKAWRYDEAKRTWLLVSMTDVDIVFRRSGTFRQPYSHVATQDMRRYQSVGLLHTLPRDCSNKWQLYQTLRKSSQILRYLPKTSLAKNGQEVYTQALQRKDVYIKPLGGAQGVGVFHLQQEQGAILAKWERRNTSRLTERLSTKFHPDTTVYTERIGSSTQFQEFWRRTGLAKCVVQNTVKLPRTSNKEPYDFRWLVQCSDYPQVVARVARVGKVGAVTTNIHTGGKAVDAETVLKEANYIRTSEVLDEMDTVAMAITRQLAEKYGHFAELGVDLAISDEGKVYVFEVNPTPGRRMLRSLSNSTRELSLQLLLEYAIRATEFSGV